MITIENNCANCEHCVRCSQGQDYESHTCDNCGVHEDTMYEYRGRELCESCLFEIFCEEQKIDRSVYCTPEDLNCEDTDPQYIRCWEELCSDTAFLNNKPV